MNTKALLLCALIALPLPCAAAKFKVLYTFGGAGNPSQPLGALSLDSDGNIYGATAGGGVNDKGAVFVRHPNGKVAILHSFTGASDGSIPLSGVVAGQTGFLYGTTDLGGAHNAGTIFSVTPKGKFHLVYAFRGGKRDGANPSGNLTVFPIGAIFGTTPGGGSNQNDGAVFSIAPDGTETLMHVFAGTDGTNPSDGVIADNENVLYGVTRSGGAANAGVVFSVTPDNTYTVLHTFTGVPDNDGADPICGLVFGLDGKLYGTAAFGGANKGGILFRISPNGSNYEILHAFKGIAGGAHDGSSPQGNLAIDGLGNIYGTTFEGGTDADQGTVYRYGADGTYRVLYAFTNGADGAEPPSGVIVGPDNTLYGVTEFGAANNRGTLFSIKLAP